MEIDGESHVFQSYNTFVTILLTSEFCCVLSSRTYLSTVSAHKTNEQFQANSQGQFCLLSYSDVTKAKGNDLPVHL